MSFDAIGIIAEDPAKSLVFYKLLGVELKKHGEAEHYEATTPSGIRLMLDSADDLNKLYDQITRAGFKSIKAPWDAFWGQRSHSLRIRTEIKSICSQLYENNNSRCISISFGRRFFKRIFRRERSNSVGAQCSDAIRHPVRVP